MDGGIIMNKHLISIILLFIFVLSVGVTSAEDFNKSIQSYGSSDANMTIGDSDSLKTFTDLNDGIHLAENESNVFNIDDDYAFSEEIDENLTEGINVILANLTVNGNNHVIDAKNKANIFSFESSNVSINDLTLVNAKYFMIGAFSNTTLVLNNVRFIDNGTDCNRALLSSAASSNVCVNNCSFYSTTSHDSDILIQTGNLSIKDSIFFGKGMTDRGRVYLDVSSLSADNVTFTDLNSRYASAIFSQGISVSVKNSRFKNLNSDLTAGAIGMKFLNYYDENETLFLIENCTFENVSCSKNGGAVFFDAGGSDMSGEDYNATLNVIGCSFSNCSSDFGGALLQAGGYIYIVNSTFKDNYAASCGGAVYTSCCDLTIINSVFSDNSADYSSGAVFYDQGTLNISNSRFTGNKVNEFIQNPNAIYIYNANVNIEESFFNNSGLSIYGVFCNFKDDGKTNYCNDELSLDNEEYELLWMGPATEIKLINNTINVTNLPSRFDLRDWNWSGTVYNQGMNGACWAFGSIGAIESALLKSTGIKYSFSPNNMQDSEIRYSKYGVSFWCEEGNEASALGYALCWIGVQPAEYDAYDELGKISDIITFSDETIHVQDAIFILGQTNETQKQLKEALLKYGGIAFSYRAYESEPYYNNETAAYYFNETDSGDHVVTLVGWDDNYPAGNFLITPPGDGAWIVKNSWGTEFGKDGYFYLSYYDKSFIAARDESATASRIAVGYIFENTIPYSINYETDFSGIYYWDGNYTQYSNEFDSINDALIGAVGTYFNETGVEYELKIYVNGNLRHTQSGTSPFAGFKTIVLNKYVPVKTGDHFKVVFKSNSVPVTLPTRQQFRDEVSFVSDDGENWIDAADLETIISLKAYAVNDDTKIINNKNIAVDYAGGSYFTVKVVTADGRAVAAGENVKFTINGKTTTVKTDSNGIAKIKITDVPKKYTMTTSYNKKTYKNTVTVKQVLTSSKVTVKKTAKKLVLKAKLKINGKLQKGKVITFKFNGKTYKVKTNAKGIAQKTLNKKVIKKLKKGKTYTVKVTYLKDTIKTTVKVK